MKEIDNPLHTEFLGTQVLKEPIQTLILIELLQVGHKLIIHRKVAGSITKAGNHMPKTIPHRNNFLLHNLIFPL
jgi:hypothetical protein